MTKLARRDIDGGRQSPFEDLWLIYLAFDMSEPSVPFSKHRPAAILVNR